MTPGETPDAPKAPETAATGDGDAARDLGKMGYAQELFRAMGGFSSFAVSFSIISVLTGITTTYTKGLAGGGPAGLGLGWPLVAVGTLVVALAMAELASAFPTAGALYHWSALFGGPGWGWLTATTNLVGQCAVVAAIDLGCAREIVAVLGLGHPAAPIAVYALVLASHAAINVLSVRLVAWLNDLSATVHVVGVVVLTALLVALARKHPVGYLADTSFTTQPSYSLGFMNALILGMYTFTGYDASAHLSEETHDPARRAPIGILSAVGVSAIAGYAYLVGLTLAVGSLPDLAKDEHAPLAILQEGLGPRAGRWGMGLAIFAMWFCGLSSVTSASRTLYAFARDDGLPGSRALKRVHPRLKTPHVAIGVAFVAALALVVGTSRLEASFFDAMVSMATMGLYVSYALPIGLGLVARARGRLRRRGPFSLGRLTQPVAALAVGWSAFVLVACSLPPEVLPSRLFAGMLVALGVVYFAFVRRRFKGPAITLEAIERDP